MEIDIGANKYPFHCFLCFLTLKLHPSLLLTTINHKSGTLSLYSGTYILKGSLWQSFVSKQGFKWSWHSNISCTESSPNFTTVWRVQRATRSTTTVLSFLILIFNKHASPDFCIGVSDNFSTWKFVITKNLQKMPVLSFSLDWDQRWTYFPVNLSVSSLLLNVYWQF